MDNLIIIAILDHGFGQHRARDDREVPFDRDSLRVEAQLVEQLGNGHSASDPAVLTIDPNSKAIVERH